MHVTSNKHTKQNESSTERVITNIEHRESQSNWQQSFTSHSMGHQIKFSKGLNLAFDSTQAWTSIILEKYAKMDAIQEGLSNCYHKWTCKEITRYQYGAT